MQAGDELDQSRSKAAAMPLQCRSASGLGPALDQLRSGFGPDGSGQTSPVPALLHPNFGYHPQPQIVFRDRQVQFLDSSVMNQGTRNIEWPADTQVLPVN